jgi:signal peptidase II
MKTIQKSALIFLILFGCVGCDQMTKEIARTTLADAGMLRFFGDTLRIQYTENTGGFLSLGATIPDALRFWIFTAAAGAVLLVLLLYLIRANRLSRADTTAFSLVLAGGLGNLLDRIFNNGQVVDFLNVGIGPLRTGIFNVADVAITAGCCWLVCLAFTRSRGDDSSSG